MRRAALIPLCLAALLVPACQWAARPPAAPVPEGPAEAPLPQPQATIPASKEPEETELDFDGLEALIASKLLDDLEPEDQPDEPWARPSERIAGDVPEADVLGNLLPKQCLRELKRLGVRTTTPTFDTPHVDTPVLVDGPIEGVEVAPRWPKADRTQEVVDCRLALAFVALARHANALGVRRVLYYSAYRPSPGQLAPRKGSQHRRGLGVDIGWLELTSGELLSVLDHYPRRQGKPPCDEAKASATGEVLRRFACAVHGDRVFHVMLTPNANADHHNHFHFDITPGATWFILK